MAFLKLKRSDLKFGRELGVGGFGTVYQATLKQSLLEDEEVAVKRLNSTDQTREIEILPQLDHPNIIKLYGVVDEKPDLFLVMELCEGGSVRGYLNDFKSTRLPFEQFCDWVKQAALPIQYLKEMKIVHKDIKTPNYLITKDGRTLKLGDFGLARKVTVTMSNATSTASYAWMAPELFTDNKLSLNYDMFSFGVVIWEFWTTEYPHQGLEPQVIAWRVCQEKRRLPIPDDCPKPVGDFLRLCWHADWKARPSIDHVAPMIEDAKAAAVVEKAKHRPILEGPWEQLEKAIGKDSPGELESPCGSAGSSNDNTVAVADHSAGYVQVYSAANLKHRFTLRTPEKMVGGRSHPRAVQVGSDGIYYVTDTTECVSVFGANGVYESKWVAVSPQCISSDAEGAYLVGLAMDTKGQLLVGEVSKKYISKHQQGGSHVASIKVGIEPESLAVTSRDTIVIGENGRGKVHILASDGHIMYTFERLTHIHPWSPSGDYISTWSTEGVTCFKDNIFICNRHIKRIHCYSASGDYLRDLPISVPGHPTQLAFTPDGKMLLVSYAYEGSDYNGVVGDVAVYKLQ